MQRDDVSSPYNPSNPPVNGASAEDLNDQPKHGAFDEQDLEYLNLDLMDYGEKPLVADMLNLEVN